jgi:hypothetical protein
MSLDLYAEAIGLFADLEREGVPYAVAGAMALAIHGVPRATADIDLLVPADAVERAQAVARARGFTIAALPMRFGDGTEMRRVTKLSEEEAVTLDLLIVNPTLLPVWDTRRRIEAESGPIWVVSRDGLLRMKALAAREQDLADIRRLEELDR